MNKFLRTNPDAGYTTLNQIDQSRCSFLRSVKKLSYNKLHYNTSKHFGTNVFYNVSDNLFSFKKKSSNEYST